MRREQRRRESDNTKTILYLVGSAVGLAIIAFIITFVIYSSNSNNNVGTIDTQKLAELVPNNTNQTQEASNPMGKTVEESKESVENKIENSIQSSNNNITTNNDNVVKENNTSSEVTKKEEIKQKEESKLEFIMPVEGEIIRKYAKEELVYSETLKEWIIHTGIDIKANKTSVVKAAEAGKVTDVNNDPRYGLTITIEHSNGMKTVYANLLTSEFVKEGEEIAKGQTIGTVGDTATFEIADEPHLHFEMFKDGETVDPSLYIK